MGERTRRLGLAWGLVAVLAGCGAKEGKGEAPGSAAIGSAGGTVTEPGGASVVVPPGAFTAEAQLRIAKDSTGAPAVPAGLTAAGDTYVITPHGGSFSQPVEVRIPAPGVTLQPNEELKLATAEPGGEWVILGDSALIAGVLSARVSSFSFFLPVVVRYPLPVLEAPPLSVTTSISCTGQPCDAVIGRVKGAFVVTTNGGQWPLGCSTASWTPELWSVSSRFRGGLLDFTGAGPISFGGYTETFQIDPGPAGQSQEFRWTIELDCAGGRTRVGPEQVLIWRPFPTYPGLAVAGSPAGLDVVEGVEAQVGAVLLGGAAMHDAPDGTRIVPTPSNHAVIEWERSDNGGASWRPIARSYQHEANPTADPGQSEPWAVWGVRHVFTPSASDQGALIRVNACYTPPDVPASPCVTGPATRLNVLQRSVPPTFTLAPRPVLVTAGQPATFTATAGGAPAPVLQWQTRAANDAGAWSDVTTGTGATTGSYTTGVLSLADNGRQYRVVASSAAGVAESPAVTASVSDLDVAPTITTQPASLSVSTGSDAAFAVVARGTETLTYQWSKGGAAIGGATGPVLRLSAVTADSAGAYSVVVTNAAGSRASDAAILSVSPGTPSLVAPVIVTQPASVSVGEGSDATFAVGVSGTWPITFQWYRGDVAIAGATAAALTLANVTPAGQGNYSVVVSNAAGSATSSRASLEVSPAPAPPDVTPPTITTQPATLVVMPGGGATLAVAVTGAGPLSYQWSHDGTPVAGATDPVLSLPSVGPAEAGSYTVTTTSVFGTAVSAPAQLILVGAPSITSQPAAASVAVGTSATFSVTATGAGLGYLWLRNGVQIAGATGPSHSTPPTTLADGGATYAVLVYNGAGVVQSQPAVLTVALAPAWQVPTLIETGDGDFPLAPELAMNPAGDAFVVSVQNVAVNIPGAGNYPNVGSIHYLAATGWQPGTPLETSDTTVSFPSIAMQANGNAMAVWPQQEVGARISIWASRFVVGAGWSAPVLIETNHAGVAERPRVGIDAAGNAIAVWYQHDGTRNNIWANRFVVGTGWGTATLIETGAGEALWPSIAVDASGDAFAGWMQSDGTRYNTMVNRFVAGGPGWGTAQLVETSDAGNAGTPSIVMDASGNALAVWSQHDGTRLNLWSNRFVAGAGWGTAALVEHDDAGDANPSSVVMDGSGNAMVAWSISDGTRANVWAARSVAGAGWDPATLIETGDAGDASYPSLAMNAGGDALAVWQQSDGSRTSIWANRFAAGTGWGTASLVETDDLGDALYPSVGMATNGNAVATWLQSDGLRNNLWASTFK